MLQKLFAVHIIVSHKTDQLQFNKQLNLIYKQNPRVKFKYMWRQLRNIATLNQMVRRKQIKYINTIIPATMNFPQQPVDAFRLSSQLEKTSSYPRNTLKLKKSETLLSSHWWYACKGYKNKYLKHSQYDLSQTTTQRLHMIIIADLQKLKLTIIAFIKMKRIIFWKRTLKKDT